MQQLTIKITDGTKEVLEKINDISFIGEFMIICLPDLRNRLVRPLSIIESYELKDLPVVNVNKPSKRRK